MSYKYGTNGNDLNWEAVQCLNWYCLDCEDIKFEIKQSILKTVDQYIPVFGYVKDRIDDLVDEIMRNVECEGHTHIYCQENLDLQQLLVEGKTLDEVCEWYIVHDTNGNFVGLVGDVPDDYLTEEYLEERRLVESA